MVVKGALELINHPEIVLLLDCSLDGLRLLLYLFLPLPEVLHIKVVLKLFIIVMIPSSTVDLVFNLGMSLISLYRLEESINDPCEEVSSLIQLCEDSEEVLVCEQALLQTFIKEVVVEFEDFIHSSHLFQALFELVGVWFKDFHNHIIDVVLAKLRHPVAEQVSLLEELLDIVLLCRLMIEPYCIKVPLYVLAVK